MRLIIKSTDNQVPYYVGKREPERGHLRTIACSKNRGADRVTLDHDEIDFRQLFKDALVNGRLEALE
jgi:hypothetical protein